MSLSISSKKKLEELEDSQNLEKKLFVFKPLVYKLISKKKHEFIIDSDECPLPRSGHRIVSEDANFYSYGGYLEQHFNINLPPNQFIQPVAQELFDELWKFNYATKSWRLMKTDGSQPNELASHASILDGKNMIVYGGTGVPFGHSSSNKMHVCNLSTLTWKQIETSGEIPTPQYGQAVYKKDNYFYVVGGTTGHTYTLDVHRLNLNTFEWELLFLTRGDHDEPKPRYRHEIAFDDDTLYIIGGGTATHAYDLMTINSFNTKKREWSLIKTIGDNIVSKFGVFPGNRKCHSLVQRGKEIFICGGYNSKEIYPDLWKLDLTTFKWTFFPVIIPSPAYFHSASITDEGCMYVFGGVTNIKKNIRTNRVLKIWLAIPSLKEMAWEAILHYNPKLALQDKNTLIKSGTPKEFVERLY